MAHGPRGPSAVRITTAAASRNDDIARGSAATSSRWRSARSASSAAILVGPGWLRWVLVAARVLLPYVAVVMANAATTKSDGFALRDARYGRPELRTARIRSADAGRTVFDIPASP